MYYELFVKDLSGALYSGTNELYLQLFQTLKWSFYFIVPLILIVKKYFLPGLKQAFNRS